MMQTRKVDVVVVGGGQAGISIGYALEKLFCSYLIIDNNNRVGDAWRKRYDSLKLFTSREYCQLPGMKMSGDQNGYPSKDEMADYLEKYTKHFELPIKNNCKVDTLRKQTDGFHITLNNDEALISKVVIIATGGFQSPTTLDFEKMDTTIPQLNINDYKNPSNLPKGTVLVVGDGATGRQIALETAKTHKTILATGKKRNLIPQQIFNKDIFWYLDKFGILSAKTSTPIAKLLRKRDPFPGKHLNLKSLNAKGIVSTGYLQNINNDIATFSEGQKEKIGSIIWASGYENSTSWIDISGAVKNKHFLHNNGVSPIEGLYYIGLPWQSCRASALITGLKRDGQYISKKVSEYLSSTTSTEITKDQPALF